MMRGTYARRPKLVDIQTIDTTERDDAPPKTRINRQSQPQIVCFVVVECQQLLKIMTTK